MWCYYRSGISRGMADLYKIWVCQFFLDMCIRGLLLLLFKIFQSLWFCTNYCSHGLIQNDFSMSKKLLIRMCDRLS